MDAKRLGKWAALYDRCNFPYQLAAVSLALPLELQLQILSDVETPELIISSFSDGSNRSFFSEQVRIASAGNQQNDPQLLSNYKADESESVRIALSKNPIITVETVSFLAGDSSEVVRENVSKHPKVTAEILEKIRPYQGFVCIDQFCAIPETIAELKSYYSESDSRIKYSPTPIVPRWASSVYRIEADGRLTFVSSDFDTSD